jgi:hypothetical protein
VHSLQWTSDSSRSGLSMFPSDGAAEVSGGMDLYPEDIKYLKLVADVWNPYTQDNPISLSYEGFRFPLKLKSNSKNHIRK